MKGVPLSNDPGIQHVKCYTIYTKRREFTCITEVMRLHVTDDFGSFRAKGTLNIYQ